MADRSFFRWFKSTSEERWRADTVRLDLWGLQLQSGTKWNPGLSEEDIVQYEAAVGATFPSDFRLYLLEMNGTDRPTLDVRGSSGEPHRLGSGFYTYPKDIRLIQELIASVGQERNLLCATLYEEGFQLSDDASLIPIYAHRYVVCSSDVSRSPVLSISDSSDAIVYGNSLREYLEREVLGIVAG
jgi:hypothetical protein